MSRDDLSLFALKRQMSRRLTCSPAYDPAARYDVSLLPRSVEIAGYAEIVKTCALGAFVSLVDNVKNAEVLGHPVVLVNQIDWEHQPPVPEVSDSEVEAFVRSVLDESDRQNANQTLASKAEAEDGAAAAERDDGSAEGGSSDGCDSAGRKRISVGLIPRQAEVQIYRNVLITAIYVLEDTMKSAKMQLFDTEYGLEIGPAKGGWTKDPGSVAARRVSNAMSDSALQTLVREELMAPPLTRLLPSHVEANIGRVVVALAEEVVNSIEFVFLGHTLRFGLECSDESRQETAEKERKLPSADTLRLVGEYVDAYIASRPKNDGSLGANPFFFSSSLERQTLVNLLANVFGEIDKTVMFQILGFDIVLHVGAVAGDTRGFFFDSRVIFIVERKERAQNRLIRLATMI